MIGRLASFLGGFLLVSQTALSSDNIPDNRLRVFPSSEERCHIPHSFEAPDILVEKEGRLTPILRSVAKKTDVMANIGLAVTAYIAHNKVLGNAFADLSVTGKRAYRRFSRLHRNGLLDKKRIKQYLSLKFPRLFQQYSEAQIEAGIEMSLDRAYQVAKVLRQNNSLKRHQLGWVAISGEDDPPHRPVNVPVTPYPQYNLNVTVNGITVDTRYMVAETKVDPQLPKRIGKRELVQAASPKLSDDAKVVLYIHGMDSRLEEGLDMFKEFRRQGKRTGDNWTMIAMDLPSSGYSEKIYHERISSLAAIGTPRFFPPGFDARGKHRVPLLDFLEDFIVQFVNQLDRKIPIKDKLEVVMGGSLGGNLTFRLGRRENLPWLKKVVTWSPASIWHGLADGADIFKQIGVATGWKRAGGDVSEKVERPKSRKQFFKDAFGGVINLGPINMVPAQPDQWWSRKWDCFARAKKLARIERQEIYNREFRLWHWRLGTEQLVYSHQGAPNTSGALYLKNQKPMLLACGEDDDFNFTNICSSTQKTAERMVNTPGKFLLFEDTGHSIHNERPALFVRQILSFL